MTTSKNVLAYAKRKDRNHKAAVIYARLAGYHVVETSSSGDGVPDLLVVGRVNHRIGVFFEIKVDNEPLREKEVEFFITYPGLAYVVRSGADNGEIAGQQIVEIMKGIEDGNSYSNKA